MPVADSAIDQFVPCGAYIVYGTARWSDSNALSALRLAIMIFGKPGTVIAIEWVK